MPKLEVVVEYCSKITVIYYTLRGNNLKKKPKRKKIKCTSLIKLFTLQDAFTKNPQLTNLLLDPYFCERISGSQQSLRQVVAQAALVGVPAPAFSAALAFYDGYRSSVLPANMLQVPTKNNTMQSWPSGRSIWYINYHRHHS